MNNEIFYFFYSFAHRGAFLDKLIVFTAETFPYFVVAVALAYVLFHEDKVDPKNPFGIIKRKWKEVTLVIFSAASAWFASHLLKNTFMTLRPFLKLPDVVPLWVESGYAFPSGHTTAFTALAFAVLFSHRKAGYVFLGVAILIGLSRIVAGVHFPVDILGGFVLGFVVAYIIKRLQY